MPWSLTDRLYAEFGSPVTFTNARFELVEYSAQPPDYVDELRVRTLMTKDGPVEELKRLCRPIASSGEPGHISLEGEGVQDRFVVPALVGGRCVGFLFFIDPSHRLTRARLEPWTATISEAAEHYALNDVEQGSRSTILAGLLSADSAHHEAAVSILKRTAAFGRAENFAIGIIDRAGDMQSFGRGELYRAIGRNSLAVDHSGRYTVVLSATSAKALGEGLFDLLGRKSPTARAGVSETFHDLESAVAAREQASEALLLPDDFGLVREWTGVGTTWRVLSAIGNTRMDSLIADPIMRFISEASSEDLDLVERYLTSPENVTEISKELYIHRGTFYYRLRRIEERFGLSFRDQERRLDGLLALKLMRLNRQASAQRH